MQTIDKEGRTNIRKDKIFLYLNISSEVQEIARRKGHREFEFRALSKKSKIMKKSGFGEGLFATGY